MDKLQELRQQLAANKEEVRGLLNDNKVEDAEAKMEEVRNLEKTIELQVELDKEEEREMDNKFKEEKRENKGDSKVEKREAFLKAVRGVKLTDEERALVVTSPDEDGGYLVPETVSTTIEELKRNYKSAKSLVDVVPTSTKAGSFPVEKGGNNTELVNFDEDNTGLAEQTPKFTNVEYSVAAYGAITPLSNSFLQDEAGNFMSYLNRLFAKKAIKTENSKIFAALKQGKTAKSVTDIKSIKALFNKDLDAAIAENARVITNQTGFQFLDEMEDKQGRPLLQPNPANATQKLLQGRVVEVFSDKELPNVSGKAPIYVGSFTDAIKMFDRGVYEVAISKEAGFTKNQTVARVIERFDVKKADADAYVYATLAEPAEPTE
ncbi:HK97 family phage major capsid protein [Virgibacillus natechei]|uniref:HK97 family phage major capsid protein n=1 Tax=Virgibacillus natechei TaxID=1216297 RepID=A0ABS4IAM8_9BACI|nr:phage major capsid protein [Virgibacillus natechei]MBP1967981.1 HK97 family phage major capsid protein [Virgibacillus natechei]UZD14733.1 phage major capsid protein [Virgibacillus natechei]